MIPLWITFLVFTLRHMVCCSLSTFTCCISFFFFWNPSCYIDSFCPSQRPCLIWDVICSINSRLGFLLLSIFFMSLSSWQRPCTGRLDWTRRRWLKRCAGAQRRICWVLRRVTRTSSLRFTTSLPVVTTHWASRKVWWVVVQQVVLGFIVHFNSFISTKWLTTLHW